MDMLAYYLLFWIIFPSLPWGGLVSIAIVSGGVSIAGLDWSNSAPVNHPMRAVVRVVTAIALVTFWLAPIVAAIQHIW